MDRGRLWGLGEASGEIKDRRTRRELQKRRGASQGRTVVAGGGGDGGVEWERSGDNTVLTSSRPGWVALHRP
jgi:hypothetical protein